MTAGLSLATSPAALANLRASGTRLLHQASSAAGALWHCHPGDTTRRPKSRRAAAGRLLSETCTALFLSPQI